MKKLLSIIVCLVLGVAGAWAKTVTSTMRLNVTTEAICAPSGQCATATVCSSVTSGDCTKSIFLNQEVSADEPVLTGSTFEKLKQFATWWATFNLIAVPKIFDFYLATEITVGYEEDYIFSHWTDPDGNVIEGLGQQGSYSYSWEAKNSQLFSQSGTSLKSKTLSKQITFTAHWVQPQVTGATTVANCGEVTDPTVAPSNGQIKFTLNRDVEADNYQANEGGLTDNNFRIRSEKYEKGSYTFNIAYKPTGVDGTYYGDLELCSKYPSTDVDNKCATATIQVVENYTPNFTTVSSYNFGNVPQGGYRQTIPGYLELDKHTYAARNAVWEAWVDGYDPDVFVIQGNDDDDDGVYSIESGEPQIRFVNSSLAARAYNATLYLKATYYDASEYPLVYIREIPLTATSVVSNTPSIDFSLDNVNLGDITLGSNVAKPVYLVMVNIDYNTLKLEWIDNNDIFDYAYSDGNVMLSISKDAHCGTFESKLKVTAKGKSSSAQYTDELVVRANIKLATPVLVACGGIGKNTLVWDAIFGAEEYTIYRDDVQLLKTTDTKYIDSAIEKGSTHSYQVEAVYSDVAYNTFSNIVEAVAEGQPMVIVAENASSTGVYTGTNDPTKNTFPYKLKSEVDLSNCFDKQGNALFDVLYVFGITTNTDGGDNINTPSASVACNAITPCYIYEKSGNSYVYSSEFDAVSTRFDYNLQSQSFTYRKLYFTGFCPFAYMGGKTEEDKTVEGWMHISGATADDLHIYLDNCEIRGRYKTPTGKNAGYLSFQLVLEAQLSDVLKNEACVNYMKGSSSPFVFSSTSTDSDNPFTPHIHISGINHLEGQLGMKIATCKAYARAGSVDIADFSVDQVKNVTTFSAPITIYPTDLAYYTHLVMDDIWPDNTIKNGYIKLDANKAGTPSEKAMAIDLGSENGSLTINGGQYHLRNSAADGTYACNLAVGYRRFPKTVDTEYSGAKISATVHLYGFGGDVADSKVVINSGTFTMYKNMYGNLGQEYYRDQGNFLDLRLPAGTVGEPSQINGGTFNNIANVSFCSTVTSTGASPKNARKGRWLCLQDVVIKEGMNENGTAQIDIPDSFVGAYRSDVKVCYDLSVDNGVATADQYGAQSLNAYTKIINGEEKQVVSLLLPGNACNESCEDCEMYDEAKIFNWAFASPKFDATIDGNTGSLSGPSEVPITPAGENIQYVTNQLMYMDIEGMQDYTWQNGNQAIAINKTSLTRGQFTNEEDYEIKKHLNFLKVVQADTWYTFTAPFNITNVYVVETQNEAKIAKKKTRAEALDAQAQDNYKLLYDIQNFIIPTKEGRATPITFEDMAKSSGKGDIILLNHYNGGNIATANYYLYQLKEEEFKETIDTTNNHLKIEWEPVKAEAGQILMVKGKTYAVQFPWCPMCNDLDSRTYYDYWSNKYILFYGVGPQTIDGSVMQSNNILYNSNMSGGMATFSGNTSLADVTVPENSGYIHNQSTDFYELNKADYTLRPGEAFLVYAPKADKMPARISRSGMLEYDENVSTDVDGLPTIEDHTSLMLFDAMDGFELLSLHDQMVVVYNMQGYVLYQQYMTAGEQVHISAAPGIYVVKGEKEALKLVVD